jgi:2-phosphosulfolactate phosphatase
VVIDIFRASSAICTAIAHGIEEIIPVREIGEALAYKAKGYIAAAERNGEVVPGFDFGNSPFSFMSPGLKGKSVVLTTSNCTSAIHDAEGASEVLVGAFVNISALVNHILSCEEDVLLLCAGWKNRYNLEDSIFAGALVERLKDHFIIECDSAFSSMQLYLHAEHNIYHFLRHSSHTQRLSHLHIERDIEYCLLRDKANVVPIFDGKSIVALQKPVTVGVAEE